MLVRIATVFVWSLIIGSAFAQPSKLDSEVETLRTYCKADVERLCPNVPPGGGRIKACLMQHQNEMTVGCAKALQGLKKKRYPPPRPHSEAARRDEHLAGHVVRLREAEQMNRARGLIGRARSAERDQLLHHFDSCHVEADLERTVADGDLRG